MLSGQSQKDMDEVESADMLISERPGEIIKLSGCGLCICIIFPM